jgi:alpha/beta superfamily hydrolase
MPVSAFSVEEPDIVGPAGTLEAKLELPEGEPKATALICHPHPLHGGTMDNKVVYTLARSFLALGAAVLRFNFRGVGASAGSYADGAGEVEDALAASAWLFERWPDLPQYLGGFSFGAAVVVRVANGVRPAGLVTVALPVERIEPDTTLPAAPWLLVHGDDDELVALDSLIDWLNDQTPGPELEVIAGADHFFHGKLTELKNGVTSFFAPPAAAVE